MADKKEQLQRNTERRATVTGLTLTVALHLLALALVSFTGLKYLYPPPLEKSLLIEFTEESEAELVEEIYGRMAQAETINPNQAVRLVQRSESPEVSETENLTPATQPDDFGDVDVPTPPAEPELDPRASFPGMSNKDTTLTAPHSAQESSETFKAGQATGNTGSGRSDGRPNARVKGRNTVGNIPRPTYNVQESGIVVVNIWVDNYGNVVKAVPGGDGTTVLDKNLYAAARNAAMNTHFNMSAAAPPMQEGTITYYFNLK